MRPQAGPMNQGSPLLVRYQSLDDEKGSNDGVLLTVGAIALTVRIIFFTFQVG